MAEITPSTIKRDFNVIVSETFDLIVIKGGIIAAGIARDASLRGFRTLLLEKDGFASDMNRWLSRLIREGCATCGGLSSVWCVKDLIDLEDVRR